MAKRRGRGLRGYVVSRLGGSYEGYGLQPVTLAHIFSFEHDALDRSAYLVEGHEPLVRHLLSD